MGHLQDNMSFSDQNKYEYHGFTTCEMQQDWKSAYKCVKSVKVSFQCFS